MPFHQKLVLTVVPAILIGLAVLITFKIASPAGYNRGRLETQFQMLEETGNPDSPIIVGNGSIYVRNKEGKFHQVDGSATGAVIDLALHIAFQVEDGACQHDNSQASGDCNFPAGSVTRLIAPWQIELYDSANPVPAALRARIGTLVQADNTYPGLLLFSTNGTTIASKPDNGGDGAGFECSAGAGCAHLNSARLVRNGGKTVSTALCTNVGGGMPHCVLRLSYCDSTAIGNGSCS